MLVKFSLWFAKGLHLFNKNAIIVKFQGGGFCRGGILSGGGICRAPQLMVNFVKNYSLGMRIDSDCKLMRREEKRNSNGEEMTRNSAI